MYKAYFIDLDGTMYHGKHRIPTAEAFIKRLQEAKIPFLFVTNNATKTPAQVAENFTCELWQLTFWQTKCIQAVAAAGWLEVSLNVNRVMVIGEEAIKISRSSRVRLL